ncbi:MAG: acyloxyacyl hydrolase [Chlorobiaceae bacterium]
MKKKLLLPLLLAGMWATPAMAANTYVSGSVGLGLLNNSELKGVGFTINDAVEYNVGVPVGVAVGYKSDEYRIEGAIGYQSYSVDKSWNGSAVVTLTDADVSVWSFMANGYYDITMKDSSISPYLTAGLGLALVKGTSAEGSFDDSVFAWQLGAGVGIKASENVILDLGYRYFKAADVTNNIHPADSMSMSVSGSNILAGVRYNF